MSLLRFFITFSLVMATTFGVAQTNTYDGRYQLQANPQLAQLSIYPKPDGTFGGQLAGTTGTAQLEAQIFEGKLVGELNFGQMQAYCEATWQNQRLQFLVMDYDAYHQPITSNAQSLYFNRIGDAVAPSGGVAQAGRPATSQVATPQQAGQTVVVNGITLSAAQIGSLRQNHGLQMAPGRYWYDKISGLWGYEGQPTAGSGLPNLPFKGRLAPNASNGNTGIYLNGRQLPQQDLVYLQAILGYLQPGKYWLDSEGNMGYEGGPALVNLLQLSQKAQQNTAGYRQQGSAKGGNYGSNGSNQNTMHRNWYTGTGSGSDGNTSYVIGDGWSVIVD